MQSLAEYHSTSLAGEELAGYNKFVSDWAAYKAAGATIASLVQKGTPADVHSASSLYFAKAGALNNVLDQQLAKLVNINDRQAVADQQKISANQASSTMVTIVVLVLSLVIGGLCAFFVSGSIKRHVDVVLRPPQRPVGRPHAPHARPARSPPRSSLPR